MKRRTFAQTSALLLICLLFLNPVVRAQTQRVIDTDINAKILKEETDNSQIMKTLHVLTDLYGPRLTGSPSLKAAGDWAVKQMQSWGFENAHLEPWDFGHPGW